MISHVSPLGWISLLLLCFVLATAESSGDDRLQRIANGEVEEKQATCAQPHPVLGDQKEALGLSFKNRNELGAILEQRGFKVGAELGFQRGLFAETTLTQWRSAKTYLLVDVWAQQNNSKDNVASRPPKFDDETQRRLEPFRAKGVDIPVCRTAVCVQRFPDHYFDYIYVDAGHNFETLYAHLVEWWPKLRPRGILAGLDFVPQDWTRNLNGRKFRIDTAGAVSKGVVNRFAAEQGVKVTSSLQEAWPTWAIVKPALEVTMATYTNRAARFPVAMRVNEEYSVHYGYKRVVENGTSLPLQWHAAWRKIEVINNMLADNATDVVFLIDDDAFVNHYWLSVDSFLARYPHRDFIIGLEDRRSHVLHRINTGVIIIRNTAWSRAFFASVFQQPRQVCNYPKTAPWHEQDCMTNLLDRTNAWEHVAEVPLGEFNCCDGNRVYKGTCAPFVFHGMGFQKEQVELVASRVREKMSTWGFQHKM